MIKNFHVVPKSLCALRDGRKDELCPLGDYSCNILGYKCCDGANLECLGCNPDLLKLGIVSILLLLSL